MKRIKNITKTKTLICYDLYDSVNYVSSYSNANFINASLQLAEEFPDTFTIVESSFNRVVIKVTDLKHCFDLYKHNEEKVIAKPKTK